MDFNAIIRLLILFTKVRKEIKVKREIIENLKGKVIYQRRASSMVIPISYYEAIEDKEPVYDLYPFRKISAQGGEIEYIRDTDIEEIDIESRLILLTKTLISIKRDNSLFKMFKKEV